MQQSTQEYQQTDKIAEAALRNLHLDCFAEDNGPRPFTSRMLHWEGETLLIAPPHHQGQPVRLDAGQHVVCSCRLGREVLRFAARVAPLTANGPDGSGPTGAIRLCELGDPQTVEQRRYYRVSLAGRTPTDVTCWLVEADGDGPAKVRSRFNGYIMDISCGGVGVLAKTDQFTESAENRQLWIRFMLPTENESLIFRTALRHIQPHEQEGHYQIGLEFLEYIEPGQHQETVDRLARFIASHKE